MEEVPPNCTVVGVPGRIVKQNNVKVPRIDMCQVDLPDPIMEDILLLQKENSALCNRVIDLEKELKELRALAQQKEKEPDHGTL